LAFSSIPPPLPRFRYKIAGDSSDDEPEPEPPGSPEPSMFMVAGPGLAGGAAGTPAVITITARDSNRRRITTGGNTVSVTAFPGRGVDTDVSPVAAAVTDRGDGSYVARFTVPVKGNYTIKVEVEDLEVEGSPFWVFFGAPGSLDVDEAAKAAEEAVAAAAASGIATAPAGSMAAAAQAAAAAATSGASAAPYSLMPGSTGLQLDPIAATTLGGMTAPKVIGSALGNVPIATPASIAAAAAGNPLAAAAAAAAAFSVPGAASALSAGTNPLTAAMASAAAAAAAGATYVDAFIGNPVHKQLACQLLAAKGVPEVHRNCVVVSKFPFGLEDSAIKALMGVAGG